VRLKPLGRQAISQAWLEPATAATDYDEYKRLPKEPFALHIQLEKDSLKLTLNSPLEE
jgi:hypothetical protein